mmetsp:Transcript_7581/g.13370  ORF Transcript_7581/g.13370 Transcript_7581/m.13370 type:complete len:1071 (-) Transcript_7581:375-3587(-)
MLTTWKHTRTSVEYALPATNLNGESAKKKKKSRKSLSSASASASATTNIIGAQFVQPLARHDPFYQERVNPSKSSRGNKKRRKFNNDMSTAGAAASGMDMEPILCLTSPHRVVFMGKGEADDSNLMESKSRNYVTRPGMGSSFSLRAAGQVGFGRGTFAGMVPPGAQYDPASNLIYAIRNGGSEVAVWTAAPSSALAGPDDEVGERMMNGKKINPREEKETMSKNKAKKRKAQQQHEVNASSMDSFVSQRLQIPDGKGAVTLTPFSIPASSSKGQGVLAAIGAAGCCDDGSIWVAVSFESSESHGQFQLLTIEGSSMKDAKSSGKTSQRRKSSAKANGGDSRGGWTLLDSRVTGITCDVGNDRSSILLAIQSVILSEDKKAQVAIRDHQVRVHSKNSRDVQLSVLVERSMKEDILQLDESDDDIAVNLDVNSDSLSIIHRKSDDGWMFTLAELSLSDGALVESTKTFPLPFDDLNGAASVFSFGKVGRNIVAVLMKSHGLEHQGTSLMSLRIIDFQRKAEISSVCWMEGKDVDGEETKSTQGNPLNKMLHGKQCHTMITNELDGSIALLTSSREEGGALDIFFSNLEVDSTKKQHESTFSGINSLASALRFVATSAPSKADAKPPSLSKVRLTNNLACELSGGVEYTDSRHSVIDEAVEKACKLMETSAKDLIEFTVASNKSENGAIANGKSRKVSSVSWREVYRNAIMLIVEAKEGKIDSKKNLINGIKGGTSTLQCNSLTSVELPQRFAEVAFKETATLILSLCKQESPTKLQKQLKKPIKEATSILVEVLQTKLISARGDYGAGLPNHGNILLSILQSCTFANCIVGKLHVIDAMLQHVQDIPEGALVSMLRLVLRNVTVEEVVAYYSSNQGISTRGARLSKKYKEAMDLDEDGEKEVGARLLSEAVLDFTSKIVTYSNCNHSFLTKAMLDSVNASSEVETLLLTLARLLKLGSTQTFPQANNNSLSDPCVNQVSLTLGTIHWISALTDAHMGTILKMTNEGGLVIDRIQRSVRWAMAQSEFANEMGEISDLIMSRETTDVVAKSSIANSRSRDTAIAPYSMERLTF